jgi:hypothetical protein
MPIGDFLGPPHVLEARMEDRSRSGESRQDEPEVSATRRNLLRAGGGLAMAAFASQALASSASASTPLMPRTGPGLADVGATAGAVTADAPRGVDPGASPLRFPMRAAFYYPWFPEAWNQQGYDPFTVYHPTLGFYDSAASSVIDRHIDAMAYGHIDVGISSWWGQGSKEDARFPLLLDAARGRMFRWAVYHETEGYGDLSVEQIRADLSYLKQRYAGHPNYLQLDGRFVVFVYNADDGDCSVTERWKEANTVGAYVVLKVFGGYRDCASQPDGWHQYGPAVARDDQSPYAYTISPGFWKRGESYPRLHRHPLRWEDDIRAMVGSGASFQLITSYNEWGEGTSVEPADEWSTESGFGSYLDALHRVPAR